MILIGSAVAVLVALWIRMRIYRNRLNRAMRAIERGGAAQRVAALFWKAAACGALIGVLWLYTEVHGR